jgi:hypothetical protein
VSHEKAKMLSFARLDRSPLGSSAFLLDGDLSVAWRHLPAPLRRLCARRMPRYGVLWLIIDR